MSDVTYRRVSGIGAKLNITGPDDRHACVQLPVSDHLVVHLDSTLSGRSAEFFDENTLAKTVSMRDESLIGADGTLAGHPGPSVKTYFAIPIEHIEFGNIATDRAIAARVNGVESWLHFSEYEEKEGVPHGSIGIGGRIETPDNVPTFRQIADAATALEAFEYKGWMLEYSELDEDSTRRLERRISRLHAGMFDERLDVRMAEVLGFERRSLKVEGPRLDPKDPKYARSDGEAPGFDDKVVPPRTPPRRPLGQRHFDDPIGAIAWDGRTVFRRMVDRRVCEIDLPSTDHLIVCVFEKLDDGPLQKEYPNTLTKTIGLGTDSKRLADGSVSQRQIPVIKTSFAIPVDKVKLCEFDKTGVHVAIAEQGDLKLFYSETVKPGDNARARISLASEIGGLESVSDIKRIAENATPKAKLIEKGWSITQIAQSPTHAVAISEFVERSKHPQKLMALHSLDRSLISVHPPSRAGVSLRVAKLLADLDAMEPDAAELER